MDCSFEYYDEAPSKPDVPGIIMEERRAIEELASCYKECRQPVSKCGYCGCDDLRPVFKKDGIEYRECLRCRALMGNATEEEYRAYRSDSVLSAIRGSSVYQSATDAFKSREWDEFCQWLTIRCHMYAGSREGLSVFDVDDRFEGLRRRISTMDICSHYEAVDAEWLDSTDGTTADVIICYDLLQRVRDPSEIVKRLSSISRPGSLLVFNTRLGTSFDLLVLGSMANVIPYEHGTLPSHESMNTLLDGHGMTPLNFTVTGGSELWWVIENKDAVSGKDNFVSHILNRADEQTMMDFQHFLQRNEYGTNARVIARRRR